MAGFLDELERKEEERRQKRVTTPASAPAQKREYGSFDELIADKERQAAIEQYAEVKQAGESGDYFKSAKAATKGAEKIGALGSGVDAAAQVWATGKPLSDEEQKAWRLKYMRRRGVGAFDNPKDGVPYGHDAARALRDNPGATREAIGDNVAIVDARGKVLAVTSDTPPIGEHISQAFTPGGDATALGAAANVLTAPLRGISTAVTHLAKKDEKDDEPFVDVLRSITGNPGKGKPASEGGAISLSEAPFADPIRMRVREVMAKNPKARVRDAFPGSGALGDSIGNRPLADLGEEDYMLMGAVLGAGYDVATVPVAPENLVAKGFMGTLKKAAKTAPGRAVANVYRGARHKIGAPVNVNEAQEALEAAKVTNADDAAKTLGDTARQSAARTQQEAGEAKRILLEEAKKVTPQQAEMMTRIVESGVAHVDDAEALRRIARLPADNLPTQSAAAVKQAGDLIAKRGRDVDLLAKTADDIVTDARARGLSPQDTQKALNRWADMQRAARPVLARAYRIVDEAGMPTHLINEAALVAQHGDMGSAAARIGALLNRSRENAIDVGLLNQKASKNYAPHVLEDGSFNPWAKRTLTPTQELSDIRAKVRDVVANAGRNVASQQLGKDLVDAFMGNEPKAMLKMRDKARKALNMPMLTDTIDEAVDAGARRGVEFNENLIENVGKYTDAYQYSMTRARAGQQIASIPGVATAPDDWLQSIASGGGANAKTAARVLAEGKNEAKVAGLITGRPAGWRRTNDYENLLRSENMVVISDEAGRKMPALAGKVVPKFIAEEVDRMVGRMTPDGIELAAAAIGKINKIWAPFVLSTPGFYIRNAMYGMFQMYFGVGLRAFDPSTWNDAAKIARAIEAGGKSMDGTIAGYRAADVVKYARDLGIVETGRVHDLASIIDKSARYKGQTGIASALNPMSDQFVQYRAARGFGKVIGGGASLENTQRTAMFLAALKMGDSPFDAALRTNKYLFDYTGESLSKVEKSIRRVIPFYQWIRFSTQQTVEMMLTQPTKFRAVNQMFIAVDNMSKERTEKGNPLNPRFEPDFLRNKGAVRAPSGAVDMLKKLGITVRPDENVRWSLERPGTQLSLLSDPGQLASALSPALQVPYELATGKSMFTGAPITNYVEGDPTMSVIENALNMRYEDMPRYALQKAGPVGALAASVATPGGSPRRLDREERDLLRLTLISMLTGQRFNLARPTQVAAVRAGEDAEFVKAMEKQRRNLARQRP